MVDDVSPVKAAASIKVPTLLVHGKRDLDTRPAHSERVFAALRGPKQLIIVPDASHNDALNARVLNQIRDWLQGPQISQSVFKN